MAKSKRRRFGSIVRRKNKAGVVYYEARYQTPVTAFAKWPGLPKHFSKNFPEGCEMAADSWLLEAEHAIVRGDWEPPQVEANKSAASRISFAEYAADYVENRRKQNGDPLQRTTKEKYRQYLHDYLLPVLGDKAMGSITPRDIQAWADSMRVGPGNEGAVVKRKVWELLRAIFRYACETPLDDTGMTMLKVSPVHIKVDKVTSHIAYGDVTMEELNTLSAAMKPRLAVLVHLIGMTGIRPGEAYALQRRDVGLNADLSGGCLNITKAAKPVREIDPDTGEAHRRIIIGNTKTRVSMRRIAIPASLAVMLSRHMNTFVADDPGAYLFTGERTGAVIDDQSVRNAWYRARKSVPRLEERKVRLYDLRHRAASYMKAYSSSDATVMSMMGHSQLSTDMHYQHELDSEAEKIISGMEQDYQASRNQHDSGTAAGNNPKAVDSPQGDNGIASLAASLENMSLDVRVNVLRGLEPAKRSHVLALFSPEAQTETMTKLLSEVA